MLLARINHQPWLFLTLKPSNEIMLLELYFLKTVLDIFSIVENLILYGKTDDIKDDNKKLEDMGYWLPVVNLEVNYKKPALYDDLITVRTIIKEIPSSKIIFYYKIFNQKEDLLNTGNVSLAFMNKITKKVCSPPDIILDKLGSKL